MEIIEGYTVRDDTSYYVYSINPDTFQQISLFNSKNEDGNYLPFYELYRLKPLDIIMIWIKTVGKKSKHTKIGQGFAGVCQVQEKPIQNKKLKID